MPEDKPQAIILSSTSPFRKSILDKLQLPFSCAKPHTDESPLDNELPSNLVARLSLLKAQAVAKEHSNALIIGSDQVCVIDGQILGKPGNFDNAAQQLSQASGKKVVFLTGLCLLNAQTGESETIVEPFTVHFKKLSSAMIKNYLLAETPYNCAGSFKSEGLGVALFERLEGDDPNSLIGLPLIRLITLLKNQGVEVI